MPKRLGLQRVVVVEHAHMRHDVARRGARMKLHADADQPALVLLLEAAR